MIEEEVPSSSNETDTTGASRTAEDAETQPLIPASVEGVETKDQTAMNSGFYKVMLTDPSAWAAMFGVAAYSLILSGFDATLPLHLRDAFGWGPAPIGTIFLGLQVPGMCLGTVTGWLRDRVGLRWPTTLGWVLLAPLLWFAGVPGRWEGIGDRTFVGCVVAIGIVMTLVCGAGTFQLTSTLHALRAKDPNAFGPGGGSSKMFSLTEMSFNTGLMLGPLIFGSLSDAYGFEYAAWTMAGVAILGACTSCIFFTHKSVEREEVGEE